MHFHFGWGREISALEGLFPKSGLEVTPTACSTEVKIIGQNQFMTYQTTGKVPSSLCKEVLKLITTLTIMLSHLCYIYALLLSYDESSCRAVKFVCILEPEQPHSEILFYHLSTESMQPGTTYLTSLSLHLLTAKGIFNKAVVRIQ